MAPITDRSEEHENAINALMSTPNDQRWLLLAAVCCLLPTSCCLLNTVYWPLCLSPSLSLFSATSNFHFQRCLQRICRLTKCCHALSRCCCCLFKLSLRPRQACKNKLLFSVSHTHTHTDTLREGDTQIGVQTVTYLFN